MQRLQLLQGDSLELMKKIPYNSVDLILADLPYGSTAQKWDKVIDSRELWKQYLRIRKPTTPIILFSSGLFTFKLIESNIEEYKYKYFWKKNQKTNFFHAKRMPMRAIEEICVFYREQPKYYPQKTNGHAPTNSGLKSHTGKVYHPNKNVYKGGNTDRYPCDFLEFDCVDNYSKLHPNEKPVELLEWLIKTYSDENDVVLDNCMGSGSCGEASVKLNRKFIGIEKDKKYFKISKTRIEKY